MVSDDAFVRDTVGLAAAALVYGVVIVYEHVSEDLLGSDVSPDYSRGALGGMGSSVGFLAALSFSGLRYFREVLEVVIYNSMHDFVALNS